jgi:hypothetical protein
MAGLGRRAAELVDPLINPTADKSATGQKQEDHGHY